MQVDVNHIMEDTDNSSISSNDEFNDAVINLSTQSPSEINLQQSDSEQKVTRRITSTYDNVDDKQVNIIVIK